MKMLVILSMLIVGASASADVVKPKTTLDTVKADIQVGGVPYVYSIRDNGWMTSGQIYPKVELTAIKDFFIGYESKVAVGAAVQPDIVVGIHEDVAQKCQELGEIEFKEQNKNISETSQASLQTRIPYKGESIQEDGIVWGRYSCIVEIKVIK
jgi:hypothetical protein